MNQSISSKCLICGTKINPHQESITTQFEEYTFSAHNICIRGLVGLLRKTTSFEESMSRDIVDVTECARFVDDKWILIRREYSSQSIPILLFYYLHGPELKSVQELNTWLDYNSVKVANSSTAVRRLLERELLALVKGDDGVFRYFITKAGMTLLKDEIENQSNKN